MKLDENLVAIHAYLCADGCVVKNTPGQKPKYYRIDLRNTNDLLLKDFQERFYEYFKVKPHLYPGIRSTIGSKSIYNLLTEKFGSFYSRKWKVPKLNNKLSRVWLRSFFDCEGWVFCKTHQNRHIGLDSINKLGILQIKASLEKIGMRVIKKENEKRNMHRLFIYGKENLELFRKEIGFLHPQKRSKLDKAINDYVDYNWDLKENKNSVRKIMLDKARIKKPYLVRIYSREKENLDKLAKYLFSLFNIEFITVHRRFNGLGTQYFELSINRKAEIKKLLGQSLINEEQFAKIERIEK